MLLLSSVDFFPNNSFRKGDTIGMSSGNGSRSRPTFIRGPHGRLVLLLNVLASLNKVYYYY